MKDKPAKYLQIPIELAKVLSTRKEDFVNSDSYEEVQDVARALLRLLMEA